MNSVSATATSTNVATSTLPKFMTDKMFAINMFLVAVWVFSIPFVYHAFTNGLDFVSDSQSGHPAFNQPGNLTALHLLAWHMMFGAMMNFISPLQVHLGLTHKKKSWHKAIGVSTIAIAFFGASVGTLYFSLYYDSNMVGEGLPPFIYQPGTVYGVVMFYVIYKVIQSLVQRDFAVHKEWAIRLFILAIGSWLNRVMAGWWATTAVVAGESVLPSQMAMGIINSWGFYIIPLAIYEVYLRLGRAGSFKNLPAYAPFAASVVGSAILGIGSVVYVLMASYA